MASTTITEVSESTTVDPGFSCYVVNAGPAGATITLPPIESDGVNFAFIRIDSSSGVVTLASASELIASATAGPTLILPANTSLKLESLNGRWLVAAETSLYSSGRKSYFSTSFAQSSGALKISRQGSTSFPTPGSVIAEFAFGGATRDTIRQADVQLDVNVTDQPVYLAIADRAGHVYGELTISSVPQPDPATFSYTIPITAPLPPDQTFLGIRVNIGGGKASILGIYSLIVF